MDYIELEPISRVDAARELESGEQRRVVTALLRISLHEEDYGFAEETLLDWLRKSEDSWVRIAAATGLGHVARIHGGISASAVDMLVSLRDDVEIGGRVEDILEDVRMFTDPEVE